jgi:hypothetical protein
VADRWLIDRVVSQRAHPRRYVRTRGPVAVAVAVVRDPDRGAVPGARVAARVGREAPDSGESGVVARAGTAVPGPGESGQAVSD